MRLIGFSIYWLTLVVACSCFSPDQMNQAVIQKLKTQQDFVHHLIFYNEQTYKLFQESYGEQLQQLSRQKDIVFYLNDCKSVKMKQCQTKDSVPLMLLFNRIFIRFNGGRSQNQLQQIYDWVFSRIAASPVLIHTKGELVQQLNKTPELFCYCHGVDQQKALFFSLNKAMIITNYCVIESNDLLEELGLKQGNITLFKNGTLGHRVQFQYKNRYDMWEQFLKINAFNHVRRTGDIIKQRFSQKNKTIDTFLVLCDLSYKCEQFWMQFQKWSGNFQETYPQIEVRLSFFDQKQNLMFNIYLHTKVDFTRFPSLLNIKLFSQNQKAGYFRRYEYYPQSQLNEAQILKFVDQVQKGEAKETYLSGQLPEKNGFTGKASQRLIQKVVAKNINQTIQNSQKHYLLLLTTFGVGCTQCQQFYKQYKKAASFLVDEDITFGFMDVLRNQVKLDNVQYIPQVLLFNKYQKDDPSRMVGRQNFDSLLKFLQNNAIINYSSDL